MVQRREASKQIKQLAAMPQAPQSPPVVSARPDTPVAEPGEDCPLVGPEPWKPSLENRRHV